MKSKFAISRALASKYPCHPLPSRLTNTTYPMLLASLAVFFAAVAGILWPKVPKVSCNVANFIGILRADENAMKFDLTEKTFIVSTQVPLDVRNNNVLPLHASVRGDIYYPGSRETNGVLIASSETKDLEVPAMSITTQLLNLNAHVTPTFSEGIMMSTSFLSECGACAFLSKENCLSTTKFFVDAVVEPEYPVDILPNFDVKVKFDVPCSIIYPY